MVSMLVNEMTDPAFLKWVYGCQWKKYLEEKPTRWRKKLAVNERTCIPRRRRQREEDEKIRVNKTESASAWNLADNVAFSYEEYNGASVRCLPREKRRRLSGDIDRAAKIIFRPNKQSLGSEPTQKKKAAFMTGLDWGLYVEACCNPPPNARSLDTTGKLKKETGKSLGSSNRSSARILEELPGSELCVVKLSKLRDVEDRCRKLLTQANKVAGWKFNRSEASRLEEIPYRADVGFRGGLSEESVREDWTASAKHYESILSIYLSVRAEAFKREAKKPRSRRPWPHENLPRSVLKLRKRFSFRASRVDNQGQPGCKTTSKPEEQRQLDVLVSRFSYPSGLPANEPFWGCGFNAERELKASFLAGVMPPCDFLRSRFGPSGPTVFQFCYVWRLVGSEYSELLAKHPMHEAFHYDLTRSVEEVARREKKRLLSRRNTPKAKSDAERDAVLAITPHRGLLRSTQETSDSESSRFAEWALQGLPAISQHYGLLAVHLLASKTSKEDHETFDVAMSPIRLAVRAAKNNKKENCPEIQKKCDIEKITKTRNTERKETHSETHVLELYELLESKNVPDFQRGWADF